MSQNNQPAESKLRIVAPSRGGTEGRQAEEALIGCLMVEAGMVARVIEIGLRPKHFEHSACAFIYGAILEQWKEKGLTDPYMIGAKLQDQGKLEVCGGLDFLLALASQVPTPILAPGLALRVVELARRRECRKIAVDLHGEAGNGRSADDVVEMALGRYVDVASRNGSCSFADELINERSDWIEAVKAGRMADESIATGYLDLDALLHGIPPGTFIPIAGYTSFGKTAFCANLGRRLIQQGLGGLYLSVELPLDQLGNRFLAIESGVEYDKLLHPGRMTEDDFGLLVEGQRAMHEMGKRLKLIYRPLITTTQIGVQVRIQKATQPIRFLIVDYLQIVSPPPIKGKRYHSRENEVAMVGQDLRRITQEEGLVTFALCQVNDDVRTRKTPKLYISDVRESRAINKHADMFWLIYYSSWEDTRAPNAVVTIDVAKNNIGRVGECLLQFDKPRQRFLDHEREEAPEWMVDD